MPLTSGENPTSTRTVSLAYFNVTISHIVLLNCENGSKVRV